MQGNKQDNIVETKSGRVSGAYEKDVATWKGIPYAAPPVGNLRFRPAQPPENWKGIDVYKRQPLDWANAKEFSLGGNDFSPVALKK